MLYYTCYAKNKKFMYRIRTDDETFRGLHKVPKSGRHKQPFQKSEGPRPPVPTPMDYGSRIWVIKLLFVANKAV